MDNQEGASVDTGVVNKRQLSEVAGRTSLDAHAERGDALMMMSRQQDLCCYAFVKCVVWMQNRN